MADQHVPLTSQDMIRQLDMHIPLRTYDALLGQ